jgi:hypothetical protein
MKSSLVPVLVASLLLVSCGKEETKPQPQAVSAAPKKVEPEKKMPPVPQGELPKMDPEKAKFIAVPSTPKDTEPKKDEKPAGEIKKADKPVEEAKK